MYFIFLPFFIYATRMPLDKHFGLFHWIYHSIPISFFFLQMDKILIVSRNLLRFIERKKIIVWTVNIIIKYKSINLTPFVLSHFYTLWVWGASHSSYNHYNLSYIILFTYNSVSVSLYTTILYLVTLIYIAIIAEARL